MTLTLEARAARTSRSDHIAVTDNSTQSTGEPSELTMRDSADSSALANVLSTSNDLTLLFALQIIAREGQVSVAKEDAIATKEQIEELSFKIQEAIKQVHDAAKSKGFFANLFSKFGVLAKVAVLVAAVASVVASGGTSLLAIAALAGTLMSTCSKELAKVAGGSELAEKIFRYGGAGMALGAGGAGAVQGLLSSGGATGGAVLSSATTQVAKQIARGATFAAAGAGAAQAGTGYVRDEYAAQELDARAEQTELRATRTHALTQEDELVQFIKQVLSSFKSANTTLRQAIDQESQSALTLSTIGARA